MSLMPTIYRFNDPGAPSLSGQPGALAALLDAVLVDGYGVGEAAKPPLGWERKFLSPNKRVYRNNPISGTGYFLRLDDSNAQYGLLRGFESMTDVDSGVGLVPTTAQMSNGCLWPKSNAASSATRAWFAIGNERCFYLFIAHTNVVDQFGPHFAGDMRSYVPDDQHCFCVSTTKLTTYTTGFGQNCLFINFSSEYNLLTIDASATAVYVARDRNGNVGAVPLAPYGGMPRAYTNAAWGGASNLSGYDIPAQANAGVIGTPGNLIEGRSLPRGEYPGLIVPFASAAYGDLNYIPGQALVTKRFAVTERTTTNTRIGEVVFDLGREWE